MKSQPAGAPSPPSGSGGKTPRSATPVEQALVERFRAALAGNGEKEQPTGGVTDEEAAAPLPDHESSQRKSDSAEQPRQRVHGGHDGAADMDALPPMTVGSLATNAPNQAASAAAQAATTAPAYHGAAVAQLLEKHVRQLLVSESRTARGDTPEVMLNLTDAALPGTKITLTQTQAGWKLASSSTSTASYRVIQELAPQLQARFAERGLGDLDLQATLEEPDD